MDLEELGMGVPDGAHSEEDEEVTARLSDHHAHHPQHHHAHHHQQHQHHDQHSKGVMLDSRYHHPHQLSHHRASSPPMAGHDGSSQDHDAGQDHQHNQHQHAQGGSFTGDGSSASNVADGTSGGDFHSTGYGYHHPDHMLPPHHLTGHHLPQSQHSMADHHQSVAASAWLPSLTNASMGGGVDQQGGGQVMYYYPGFMAHPHQQPHHVHPYGGSAGAPMPPQFSPDFMHHHTGMHPHAYDRGMAQPQHPHSHHPHHPHHHQMQLLQAAEHGIPHLAPGASSPASSSPSSSIISAVSKSKKGDGGKRKRQRTTPEQLEVLEKEFSISPTPAREVRHRLSLELMMTPRQVQVWFQNKRAKEKKIARKSGNAYTFQSASSSATSNSTTSSNSNNTDSPNEAHSPPQYHQPQPGSPPSYHPHQPLTFNPHDNHHHSQYSSDGSPTTTTAAHPHFPMPHHLPHPHYQHPSQNYPQLPFAMNMASHVEGGYETLLIGSDERQYSKQDSGGGLGELRNYAESLAVKIQNQCLAANRAIFAFRTDKQQSDWAALMEAVNTIAREVDGMRDHLDHYFKRGETLLDESKIKDGDAWWTPVFTLLHFITDLYQNNFLDDDTELVNNARCEVDKAIFGLWTQACSIFFPHMTVAQCKRWTETATTLDPSGYLSFEGDLKEVELTKRYQEFERLRTIKSYKSFLARANPAQHEQIRERVMASIDPQNVDLRSIILLNHQLYDEVINEIEQHPSSAFIRQNIIGDAPSHSQQLLCYKRPQYVINKAEEVLQKQLAVVLDALFLRFIKTSDLKRLFEKRNSNEFLKALQASLEEEARANPPEPPVNGDFLWHNNNKGEEQEHEEKKAKEEDRDKPDAISTHPHANFYSGIEGWLNCARMAFNVLATSNEEAEEEEEEEEQDEEEKSKKNRKKEEESRKKAENGFKEFCKKLEEFFLEKAKEKEDKNEGGAEKMVELCCQYVRLASEATDSNEDDESNEEAEDDNHAKNKKKKGTKRKRESPTTPTSIGYGVGPWFPLMKLVAAVRGRTLWTLASLRR